MNGHTILFDGLLSNILIGYMLHPEGNYIETFFSDKFMHAQLIRDVLFIAGDLYWLVSSNDLNQNIFELLNFSLIETCKT